MSTFRRQMISFWAPLPSAAVLVFSAAACNPFAPALEEGDPLGGLIGDQTTIDGFFTNFRNAYELRDLSLYERLLDSSFVFVWRDFDAQVERQWSFAQDLETTRRLFVNSSLIRLQWNQVISQDTLTPQREVRVVRSFNLTVTLEQGTSSPEAGNVFRTEGNVNFLLARPDSTAVWRLRRWRDESVL